MLETASSHPLFASQTGEPVDWIIAPVCVPYPEAVAGMEHRVEAIIDGSAPEAVWLLEHPPLYTAGTSAKASDLLSRRFPVYESGRGGQYTYHGPGQRIAYVMLDLKKRKQDVRAFVQALEDWLIDTLWDFHIRGEKRCDRVGVWVRRDGRSPTNFSSGEIRASNAASTRNGLPFRASIMPISQSDIGGERPDSSANREDKIAAIGIRLRKWVSLHGIALNVTADLSHYDGIVPCGVSEHGVTSFEDLGLMTRMEDVDIALRWNFEKIFGKTETKLSF